MLALLHPRVCSAPLPLGLFGHAVPTKPWEQMIFVLIHGVWVCICVSPGLSRLSARLFLSVRGISPLPPGLLRPVQCFSLGGGIVEPVTKIHHTRGGEALGRSRRSQRAPCWAPLWFRGSLASPAPSAQLGEQPPAPPQPCTPGTTPHAPALRISGCGGKSSAAYPIQPPPLQVMNTLVRKLKKI